MATTITDVLNVWNDVGVFSYVIPFLLIFAVVFAILKKTKILSGEEGDNDGILAIIAVALGLLSLQFDMVSNFFAIIFPRFAIGISIFLVLIIFIGFFMPDRVAGEGLGGKWIGYLVGLGVVLWAINSWSDWVGYGFGYWWNDNFWALIILGAVVGVIALAVGGKKGKDGKKGGE